MAQAFELDPPNPTPPGYMGGNRGHPTTSEEVPELKRPSPLPKQQEPFPGLINRKERTDLGETL